MKKCHWWWFHKWPTEWRSTYTAVSPIPVKQYKSCQRCKRIKVRMT